MRAGLLTEQITIQKRVEVASDFASRQYDYIDYITTRAQVVHTGGNKSVLADEVFTSYAVKFIIRLYHDVSPEMLVVYNGQKYEIKDINVQRAQQSITLTTELIND
jgi:SPP1 family predicted phage head-tail adaptor